MRKYTPIHVLLVAFGFSVIDILTRVALDSGAHALTFVMLRSIGVVTILGLFLRATGVSLRLEKRERNVAFGIGAVSSINIFSLAYAIGVLPVPLVMLIFYTYPAMTSVAAWLSGKDRPTVRSVGALLLALVGLALAMRADMTGLKAAGLGAALLSALSQSVMLQLVARFFGGADPRPRTYYMQVAAVVMFVTASLVTGTFELPQGAMGWTATTGVPFLYAVGLVGLLAATAYMGAVRSTFYMNFGPIGTIGLSAVFLDQTLSPVQIAGAIMVIGALFLFRPLPRPSRPTDQP